MKAKFDGRYCYAPEDAISFYEQSGYGRKEKDGKLRLDPKEALYLMARGKLNVVGYTFDSLLTECASDPRFLRNFIVYRDVRERGYVITTGPQDFRIFPRGQRPGKGNSRYLMRVLSERDLIDFTSIIADAKAAANMRKQLVLAVLDDEHELTYYEVRLTKHNTQSNLSKGSADVGACNVGSSDVGGTDGSSDVGSTDGNSVANHDPEHLNELPEKIQAKLAGIPAYVTETGDGLTKTLMDNWFGTMMDATRLFLSPLETAWLLEKGKLTLDTGMGASEYEQLARSADSEFAEKLTLYRWFKALGLYPRSGYKYGHHFRVYAAINSHSEMLADAIMPNALYPMSKISRSVRLAHSVRKKMLFAAIDCDNITSIEFARLKM